MSYDPPRRWLAVAARLMRAVAPLSADAAPPRWGSPPEVAAHEAGHAVVAAALGLRPTLATIDPAFAAGANGLVAYGDDPPAPGSLAFAAADLLPAPVAAPALASAEFGADAVCLAAVQVAGHAAESMVYRGHCAPPAGLHSFDAALAQRVLSSAFAPQERRHAYAAAFNLAGMILADHWRALDGLVLALLRHRTLVGERLGDCLAPVVHREQELRVNPAAAGDQDYPPSSRASDPDALAVRRLFRRGVAVRGPDFPGRGVGWHSATALPVRATPLA